MKKRILFEGMVILLLVSLGFTSCKKNNEVLDQDAITFLEFATSANGDGVAKQAKDLAADLDYIISYLPCDTMIDTTVYYKTTGLISCNYTFLRQYQKICAIDTTIISNGNNSGTYSDMKSNITGNDKYAWKVVGVTVADSNYLFNGTTTGSNTLVTKGSNSKTYKVDWTLDHKNIDVQKFNGRINSGTSHFSLHCKVDNGGDYNFTGTINYNGNGYASIEMNGKNYSIQLY